MERGGARVCGSRPISARVHRLSSVNSPGRGVLARTPADVNLPRRLRSKKGVRAHFTTVYAVLVERILSRKGRVDGSTHD